MDGYTGQGVTTEFGTDFKGKFRYKTGISRNLDWQQVNEITWKLTDGEMTNVPACHGHWGGYRTTKPVAWVIDIGVTKPAWLARCKDQCSGPLPLKDAKAVAIAMAKGAPGDYRINDPINHLNALASRLVDQEAA